MVDEVTTIDVSQPLNSEKPKEEKLENLESQDEMKKKRLNWKEFYSSTTVHGFHYIFDETGIRRIIWLLVFLGAFFLSGYLFIGVIYDYSHFRTLTSWSEEDSETTPEFPSVTICLFNSKIRRQIGKTKEIQDKIWNAYETFIKTSNASNLPVNFTENLKEAMKNSNTEKFSDFLQLFELQITDLIEDKYLLDLFSTKMICSYDGVPCNVSWFKTSLTQHNGACFEINYFIPGKESNNVHSMAAGFKIAMNIHSDDAYTDAHHHPYNGVSLLIHNYGTAPITKYATFLPLPTGTLNIVQLETSKTTLAHYPYENGCGSKEYTIIKSTLPYSKGMCELDCAAEKLYKEVGCLGYYFERIVDEKFICGVENYINYRLVAGKLSEYKANCRKECFNECEKLSYKISNNNLVLGTDHEVDKLKNMMNVSRNTAERYLRKNIVALEVKFSKTSVITANVVPAVTWKTMLGSLGGNLGLCLGISILTVCEFLYFGLNKILSIYQIRYKM